MGSVLGLVGSWDALPFREGYPGICLFWSKTVGGEASPFVKFRAKQNAKRPHGTLNATLMYGPRLFIGDPIL